MNPVPYNYPPYEPIVYDGTSGSFIPSVLCDGEVRFYQGFMMAFSPTTPEIFPPKAWCPRRNFPSEGVANLVDMGPHTVADFVYTGVPPGILNRIVYTVTLHTPLTPGVYPEQTSFFSATPTDSAFPFGVGFTLGSTDSWVYKQSMLESSGRTYPWREMEKMAQNFFLKWWGLDDAASIMDLEVLSVTQPNDTYRFSLDMSKSGIVMTDGDRLRYFNGQKMTEANVRSVYLKFEFSRQLGKKDIPYIKAGARLEPP